jgi:tetratricopeptide (TPR) repeat protein
MKRNIVVAILFTFLLTMVAVPAFAQNGTVQGVCKDAAGTPIAGAAVTWQNQDNGQKYNLKTDKGGKYFSLGITPGTYTVTLTQDGKELDHVKGFHVGLDVNSLDFDLKKSQEESAKQSGMTPEQLKKLQEQQANLEKSNANIKAVNEKLSAATTSLKATPPDYDTAINLLKEATQMAPNEDLVWFRLGAAYLDSAKAQTDAAERTKRYTEAFNNLQKAIDLRKSAAANAAPAPAAGGKPAGQAPPDNARTAAYYDNLGAAAAHIGKSDDAVNAYKQAVELNPAGAGQYYYNLGALLTNANMANDVNIRKQAIEAFDKAIAADPNRADAYFWKGQNYMGMASTDNAGKIVVPEGTAESYQKYLELQPAGPHAEESKQMLAALNATVETNYGTKKGTKKK